MPPPSHRASASEPPVRHPFSGIGHDEIHGAVANTVAVAAIVVGDALETHLDDANNGRAILH